MTAVPVTPPPRVYPTCPGCRRTAPLLVEGSDLCLGCDSLIPTRPFPGDDVMVQNLGQPLAYIGGNGHRPIPLATAVGVRPAHKPAAPRVTGLDWSKHTSEPATPAEVRTLPTTRACKGCRVDTDLEDLADGFCPSCVDAAIARFAPTGTAPHDRPTPAPVQQTEPTREVVTVATPNQQPAYVDDIVAVMVATDGHPDPAVRAARKVVANALVALHKTLGSVFPQVPAAATTPTAAAGTSVRTKGRYKRLTPDETAEVIRRYQAGESTTALGKAFGVSGSTVANKLHAAGIPVRPKAGAK